MARRLTAGPLTILLHSWTVSLNRRFLADILINIALYVPLGMTGYLSLSKRSRWLSLLAPAILGTMVSASVEMAQIFTPSRDCSALDLVNNVVGSALGVFAGMLFDRAARPRRFHIPDRAALALLFCWAASLLFPLFPVMWLGVYRQKLTAFSSASLLDPIPFFSACASWFAAGYLIRAAGLMPARRWLAWSLVLLPAQFFVINRQPLPAELGGAVFGVVLFRVAKNVRKGEAIAAGASLLVIAARGLTPLSFTARTQQFQWIPFGGFLSMNWQAALQLLLEKAFLYGLPVWLLKTAVARLPIAVVAVCALLLAIEVAQLYLPGHTAEITDPTLALLIGAGIGLLQADSPAIRQQPTQFT